MIAPPQFADSTGVNAWLARMIPVEVGLENLASVVDHRRIERTGIDPPDPGVVNQ